MAFCQQNPILIDKYLSDVSCCKIYTIYLQLWIQLGGWQQSTDPRQPRGCQQSTDPKQLRGSQQSTDPRQLRGCQQSTDQWQIHMNATTSSTKIAALSREGCTRNWTTTKRKNWKTTKCKDDTFEQHHLRTTPHSSHNTFIRQRIWKALPIYNCTFERQYIERQHIYATTHLEGRTLR